MTKNKSNKNSKDSTTENPVVVTEVRTQPQKCSIRRECKRFKKEDKKK